MFFLKNLPTKIYPAKPQMNPKLFIKSPVALALFLASIIQLNLRAEEIIEPDIGDPYPLETCILSGESLEEDPEIFDYQGQEVRVCCSDCKTRFSDEAYLRADEINAQIVKEQTPFYPLKKCIVTGKDLAANAVDFVFRNRLFRLASSEAEVELKKDPGKYFGDLDLAVVEKQKNSYPLKTCVISGQALGDESIEHVVANQLVRLAGFDQLTVFNENPGKYLAVIRAAR